MSERRGVSHEREREELLAELRACSVPQERATIHAELDYLGLHLRRRELQQDELQQVPELWQDIYGRESGFIALFSGMRPNPGAKLREPHEAYFAWPREVPAALRWIRREADQDRDIYHCGHLVGRWRRRKTDALPVNSLYADLDSGLSSNVGMIPSVLVESSPDHHQAYFRLTRRVAPEEAAALNRRLSHRLGGDLGGWDLTQLLRIPGTANHKYGDQPLVRVVQLTGLSYDPDELDRLLPPLPEPYLRSATTFGNLPPVGSDPPVPLTRSAHRVWNGEDTKQTATGMVDRSASLIRIARILLQAGLAPHYVAAVLAERDASLAWNKYSGRKDAPEQYHRIVDVVEGESRRSG